MWALFLLKSYYYIYDTSYTYGILESCSKYSRSNFPVTIFFFQKTYKDIWLVYFFGPTPIFHCCSYDLQISWTVLILYLTRTHYMKKHTHTHIQFLSTICPSFTCFTGRGSGEARELIVEKEMWKEEERAKKKNAGRCVLVSPEYGPEHLPSSTACVRQEGFQWSNNVGWLFSFCPYPQGLAGLTACNLGSCFLLCLYGLWRIPQLITEQDLLRNLEISVPCPSVCDISAVRLRAWDGMGFFEYAQQHLGKFSFAGRMPLSCKHTWFIDAFDMLLAPSLLRLIYIWWEQSWLK